MLCQLIIIIGALGSWGAALLAPYSDRPETSGLLVNSKESLRKQIRQFWMDGWQVVCLLNYVSWDEDMTFNSVGRAWHR